MCLYATLLDTEVPTMVHARPDSLAESQRLYMRLAPTDLRDTFYGSPRPVHTNLDPNFHAKIWVGSSTTGYWVHATRPLTASDRTIGATGGVDHAALAEHDDVRQDTFVKVDSELPVGGGAAFDNVTMIATYLSPGLQSEVAYAESAGHHYGWAECENIGRCDSAVHVVGSKCSSTWGAGHCYYASDGVLSCGRTLSVAKRLGATTQVTSGSRASSPVRCPSGSAALDGPHTGKRVTTKRLLVAGCMAPSDESYDALGEVHVPHMCTVPQHYKQGCLLPSATNYAPGSAEPGPCKFANTKGCTDPTAVNYNWYATADDGSCIAKVEGCTLSNTDAANNVYAGVDPATPGFQSLYLPLPGGGKAPVPIHPAVANPNPSANVNVGCLIAIEGCTDPTAGNYDSRATTNTVTWCVPNVEGCLMPNLAGGAPIAPNQRDVGGAANYNPLASRHQDALCTPERKGCTAVGSINYDARATTDDGSCFADVVGCLDSTALNFGCKDWQDASGHFKCESCTTQDPPSTRHLGALCNYQCASGEAEILGELPPGKRPKNLVVTYTFTAEGDVSDIETGLIAQKFADTANVGAGSVEVKVVPASVAITVRITVQDHAAALLVQSALSDEMSSASAASDFLGIAVTSAPRATIEYGELEDAPASNLLTDPAVFAWGWVLVAIGSFLCLTATLYSIYACCGKWHKKIVPVVTPMQSRPEVKLSPRKGGGGDVLGEVMPHERGR